MKNWRWNEKVAAYHGKKGPNKIFGSDVDVREKFSEQQALQRFEDRWNAQLGKAVEAAEKMPTDRAKKRIPDWATTFFRADQEHREFRISDCELIAQIKNAADNPELTALWWIPSTDTNPKAIFVEFDTVEERKQFKELAIDRGWSGDQDLALSLLRDFMRNCKGRVSR